MLKTGFNFSNTNWSSWLSYNYLGNNNRNYDALYTGLNSPFFTFDNLKLNSNIYYIEVFNKIENIINKLQKDSNKNLKILEIGPGKGQLANIIFDKIICEFII